MKKALLLLGGALMINFSVYAAGDVEAGKSKSAKCVSCHGVNGKVSIPTYPNLAGQNEVYLDVSMHAYKKGERTGGLATVMSAYVNNLSDQDIADLAAYYASLGEKE
ncbi:c-type cytochrome [Pragia fontium]|uniref:Cytochrome c553 n=2 Tax=Pragia fontium TaxID=82985 RepID=A0AAJ4WA64_9GAMM|nr:cytochrome c [Pragia fontium]AKJ43020.1 cytochrome C554 [Pragia fontium]SFC70363.1 Cytochrome c553 [Pragia fontium DSM 5563 = ATCC 49100]SUB83449.1 Cytochrome c-554(548) [Pragia fontium]VEJ56354.1 Cytochrome c-554(548) [Pragia fontium]GKX63611.1 cytochrome c554 [Pragia fontium]